MIASTKRRKYNGSDILLVNIGQLLTLRSPTSLGPRRGPELNDLGIVKDAAVLCVGGKIVSAGTTRDALRDSWVRSHRKQITEIDCEQQVVLPGFVDSHTHPVFVGPRLVDFEKRIQGSTYEEIAAAGGGIRSSLQAVRAASERDLADAALSRFQQMATQGTTTIEAKSGYGLTVDSEIKSLQAIRQAAKRWPGSVVPTLLGAHVVPEEFADRREKYVDLVCSEMIPHAARQKLARFVDVFTEKGAFSVPETMTIFSAARKHGLGLRAHVCQLSSVELRPLLELEPASLDHMDHVSRADAKSLAKHNTVATLVPGANYFLGLSKYPNARQLIDGGAAVALATDYNPGSAPTPSIPVVMSLACTHMKMTPAEAISASTINGAWALQMQGSKGSIEPGKDADFACFPVKDYREIAYWFAAGPCAFTLANGTLVV